MNGRGGAFQNGGGGRGGYSNGGGNGGRTPTEPVTALAKDTQGRKWAGTKGQGVKLVTNYFHLDMPAKEKVIYRYHVDVYLEAKVGPRREVKVR